MRLLVIPPAVQPEVYLEPRGCPHAECGSHHVQFRQAVRKLVRDTQLTEVIAHRYQCPRCGRTFRVYPVGVNHDQTSARLKGVAGLRREALRHGGGRVVALGADLTSVRCAGQWLTVGVSVDAVTGLALSVDLLPTGEATTLTAWVTELAQAIGAEVLVSDDADPFKRAADASGLLQQVCKAHVRRNTAAWVETITPALATDSDGSLALIGVAPTQAVADCQTLLQLMTERQPTPEASALLATIHRRYLGAAKPVKGATMSLAYRVRLFSLDRWNLWPRLTRYRTWAGPDGEQLDGTNNGCERAIGWWVKERYRSMRGYKRPESVINVSRLIAAMGNALESPGFALAEVIA
jgi:hypothetical protein